VNRESSAAATLRVCLCARVWVRGLHSHALAWARSNGRARSGGAGGLHARVPRDVPVVAEERSQTPATPAAPPQPWGRWGRAALGRAALGRAAAGRRGTGPCSTGPCGGGVVALENRRMTAAWARGNEHVAINTWQRARGNEHVAMDTLHASTRTHS
jgi:hypothetical protein